MKYISTRNKDLIVSGSTAVLSALAEGGGLFVPSVIPSVTMDEIKAMEDMDYAERAALVMSLYFDELSYDAFLDITNRAYSTFDGDAAPVLVLDEGMAVLELWHGKTHAFKDMALSVLPRLLTALKNKTGQQETCLIPVATSGDTGKAALEGFADVPGTAVIVFYPSGGVSSMQQKQMCTTEGGNVCVVGVDGNFDDAQTAVKEAMISKPLTEKLGKLGFKMTGANSINWGRLAPQIAYYFSAYVDMASGGKITWGDKLNFCVPTGNFGNILAGYYAKRMGLPVGKLICASNDNNVLTDFINTGTYSVKRDFKKTISPSMDILVSSNLERLLFELAGRNDKAVAGYMSDLKTKKEYSIPKSELDELQKTFVGLWADEDEDIETISFMFDEYGYICDTHTGVAFAALMDYTDDTNDKTPCVVVSTASPYKFVQTVLGAIGEKVPGDDLAALLALEDATALPLPESLPEITKKGNRFTENIRADGVNDAVLGFAESMVKA